MVSEDHHNKVKREELRSLIREALPVRNFSNSYLSKRLTLEVTIDNEKDYVIVLYGSLTQISNKFWLFWNFDSYFVVLLVDFNAKLNAWLVNHTNIWEGKLDLNLENSTSMYGMKQLISSPTHFYNIKLISWNCIDLIFVSQQNVVIKSGIHPSLHQNCHHQVIFWKLSTR